MHIITVEFIANTEDEEKVREAHRPVFEAFMAHEACLGAQLLRSKSRKEPLRYLVQTCWRSKEEAIAVSSKPEVMAAHDKIYEVQTRDQKMSVWGPVSQYGIFAGEDIRSRLRPTEASHG
ncbi:MAG: antibiotic biosynthesis monooxygenase [Chloroflexota bacterium]|nr:antibiotic biosynthesis monooxygenase [Dehalococcoidia bacterium]MDW8253427.1 antibiotic biosynthesis monooxygenase [Chloroflexota bacterium]